MRKEKPEEGEERITGRMGNAENVSSGYQISDITTIDIMCQIMGIDSGNCSEE